MRKDGLERRMEADWIKKIYKIIYVSEVQEKEIIKQRESYGDEWMTINTIKKEHPSYFGRPDYCKSCQIIKDIIE